MVLLLADLLHLIYVFLKTITKAIVAVIGWFFAGLANQWGAVCRPFRRWRSRPRKQKPKTFRDHINEADERFRIRTALAEKYEDPLVIEYAKNHAEQKRREELDYLMNSVDSWEKRA